MRFHPIFLSLMASLWVFCAASPAANAQQRAPIITWQSLLNTPMWATGKMAFRDYDIAFAPPVPLSASFRVMRADGQKMGEFKFFDTYRYQQSVFAKGTVAGPAEITFAPGRYAMQFTVAGVAATQFVFNVEPLETSDDPFNPSTTVKFVGPWQKYAYFMFPEVRNFGTGQDLPALELRYWAGAQDKPSSMRNGQLFVKLMKDGQMVAQSKRTGGFLANEAMRTQKTLLFKPHEQNKEANALAFYRDDLVANDGTYQVVVERKADGKAIRTFSLLVQGGKMIALPQTQLTYKPAMDVIVPRVMPKGQGQWEFSEAFWIAGP